MLKDIIETRIKLKELSKQKNTDKLPVLKDSLETTITKNGEVIEQKENK
jgi:hypothetical protein